MIKSTFPVSIICVFTGMPHKDSIKLVKCLLEEISGEARIRAELLNLWKQRKMFNQNSEALLIIYFDSLLCSETMCTNGSMHWTGFIYFFAYAWDCMYISTHCWTGISNNPYWWNSVIGGNVAMQKFYITYFLSYQDNWQSNWVRSRSLVDFVCPMQT